MNQLVYLLVLQEDRRILTASGDQTLGLWDTSRAACLGVFKGHHGSVKCVRPKPDCPDVFASGKLFGRCINFLFVLGDGVLKWGIWRKKHVSYGPIFKQQNEKEWRWRILTAAKKHHNRTNNRELMSHLQEW